MKNNNVNIRKNGYDLNRPYSTRASTKILFYLLKYLEVGYIISGSALVHCY